MEAALDERSVEQPAGFHRARPCHQRQPAGSFPDTRARLDTVRGAHDRQPASFFNASWSANRESRERYGLASRGAADREFNRHGGTEPPARNLGPQKRGLLFWLRDAANSWLRRDQKRPRRSGASPNGCCRCAYLIASGPLTRATNRTNVLASPLEGMASAEQHSRAREKGECKERLSQSTSHW
jgi:hypothetical protein